MPSSQAAQLARDRAALLLDKLLLRGNVPDGTYGDPSAYSAAATRKVNAALSQDERYAAQMRVSGIEGIPAGAAADKYYRDHAAGVRVAFVRQLQLCVEPFPPR